jgi:PD-(D/E)XK nuclease superfamily
MKKRQLHQSGLQQFWRCGEAYRRRYIEREKTPQSANMAIGTAVDASSNADLSNKIQACVLLPQDEVQDIARDTVNREWDSVRVTDEDRDEGPAADKGDAVDAAVGLAGFHHETVAPILTPTHVQRPFVLDLENYPDWQLAGTIDVQALDDLGGIHIRDLKTSGKSPVKTLAHDSLQLTMYAMAVRVADGQMVAGVHLDYTVRTPKRHELKYVALDSTRDVDDFGPLFARVENAIENIEAGRFAPAPTDAWWCTQKFCAYFETCRYARKPKLIQVTKGDETK